MKITACRLQVTAFRPEAFPRDGRPGVAFMGRSNVGKSSLINRLLGRRGLAPVSKSPGRTRAIGFYLVNDRIYFVDLPGYGYARVPGSLRQHWKGLVEAYLEGPWRPDLAVQLVDARHGPTDLDLELLSWLRSRAIPRQIVLTKSDDLPASRTRALSRNAPGCDWPPGETPLPVSAVTGLGIPVLWRAIDQACRATGREPPRRGMAMRTSDLANPNV